MNYTIPGRLHIIYRHRKLFYLTFWFWGSRYHYEKSNPFAFIWDLGEVVEHEKRRPTKRSNGKL